MKRLLRVYEWIKESLIYRNETGYNCVAREVWRGVGRTNEEKKKSPGSLEKEVR